MSYYAGIVCLVLSLAFAGSALTGPPPPPEASKEYATGHAYGKWLPSGVMLMLGVYFINRSKRKKLIGTAGRR